MLVSRGVLFEFINMLAIPTITGVQVEVDEGAIRCRPVHFLWQRRALQTQRILSWFNLISRWVGHADDSTEHCGVNCISP